MNRIKELRKKNKLTQKALAKKVGLSNQSISFYELGKREPKIEAWQKLADFFGVSIPYLQGLTDIENEPKEPCDYCDFTKRDRAAYALYGDKHTWLGMVCLDNIGRISVDLREVGTIKADVPVKRCFNCGRVLND